MSYLAMSAETLSNDKNDRSQDNLISKKKYSQNRTQKYKEYDQTKVNSVLKSIHNMTDDDDDDNYVLSNHSNDIKPINPYSFPEKPISGKQTEGFAVPQPMSNDKLDLRDIKQSFMNQHEINDYYHKHYRKDQSPNDDNVMLNKLNYLIHLLEEQQDQKTGSAIEDVILYSFMGIFVIFVIDSFVKVGKYVR